MFNIASIKPIAKDDTTVVTSPVRLVSGSIFSRQTEGDFASNKYEATVVFDANESPELLSALEAAISAAKEKGLREIWNGKLPEQMRCCLKAKLDYDKTGVATKSSTYYLNARSDFEPRHFDAARRKLTSESEFYPGCYVRVQIGFYPWYRPAEENAGISAILYAVQKLPSVSTTVDMDDFFIPELEDVAPATPTALDSISDDGTELPF